MALKTVEEIEEAITALAPEELGELCEWLDQYQHPFDARIEADFAAGRLDGAIRQAQEDELNGRVQPL